MADEPKTYTQDEVDGLIAERIAENEAGLKANRDEALREAKKAKAALKAYDGIDADEARTLKEQADEAQRKKAKDEGDFEAREKQLVERHQQELQERDGKIEKLTKTLHRRTVQAELTKAISVARGDPDLLLPHAEKFVRVRETDEDFVPFVADEHGNPRVADGQGTPMTFEQLIEQELKPKYPRAFDGTGSSGGGAPKSVGGAGGQKTIQSGDNDAFLQNLEGIAKGEVSVQK